MDEPAPFRSHLRWLFLLLAIAAGLRAWQITHTEVATRDSIGYTRFAWRLGVEPFADVLKTSEHHPGYPVLIHLASVPVRAFVPDDLPRSMQLSAQLVSCLAGILLVIPAFFLGCELFDRRVGFWGALLFQVLPSSGKMMPDGLTEPVFLLFAACALFAGCRAIRTGGARWFVAAGLASGLAYLTRAEGLLLAASVGLVLVTSQTFARWRRPWGVWLRDGVALSAATLVVAVPFMLSIGKFTQKPSAALMLNSTAKVEAVTTPLPVAAWDFGPDARPEDRYGWAAKALVSMIDKGFFHVLTLPFLAGLFVFRRRCAERPATWVPLILMALLLPILYRLGQSNGYLGERHVMLIVLVGIYWAVAALIEAGAIIARRWPRVSLLTPIALALLCLAPLPKTLARLHGERAPFRQAGAWLADHAEPDAMLIDPFSWSSYYAGRTFATGYHQPTPEEFRAGATARVCYVVLDEGGSKHEHLWYLLDPAREFAGRGRLVERFHGRGRKVADVVVYRVVVR